MTTDWRTTLEGAADRKPFREPGVPDNRLRKLTFAEVDLIRKVAAEGTTIREICEVTGMGYSYVRSLVAGNHYERGK